MFLESDRGLEQRGGDLLAQAWSRIVYVDQHALAFSPGENDDRALRSGRFGGILQEIGQDAIHHIRRRMRARTSLVEPKLIVHARMDGTQQRDAFGDYGIDVEDFGMHLRLARELREGPHPPLERFDFAHDDLNGLIHERALRNRLPYLHFLDGQPNRRQRVLQLVRRLPRQRLPAGHARQVHEPLAVLLELIRHVVERADGATHFVARAQTGFRTGIQPP
jgi:hypothetical protein